MKKPMKPRPGTKPIPFGAKPATPGVGPSLSGGAMTKNMDAKKAALEMMMGKKG